MNINIASNIRYPRSHAGNDRRHEGIARVIPLFTDFRHNQFAFCCLKGIPKKWQALTALSPKHRFTQENRCGDWKAQPLAAMRNV